MAGSFRFARYDGSGRGIDDPEGSAPSVPGDGIPIASAALATTVGEAGQMYRLMVRP